MTVYVDTSALYAVLDRDDALHAAARDTWVRILSSDDELLASNYVILETFALTQHRLGMDALRTLNDEVLPAIRIHWVGESDHLSAAQAALAANRRELSLVDAASFRVMRRLKLRSAFTFDHHFQEQGFQTLPE